MSLQSFDFDSVAYFSFAGLQSDAKVVNVYDGDTLTIGFYYNNAPIKLKLRMEGYDSPEIKPLKSIPDHDLHKSCGLYAKTRLESLVYGKIVRVHVNDGKNDKYGRLLGKIYLHSGECVNDIMMSEGYGKPYNGGTKAIYTSDDLKKIECLHKSFI